MKLKDGMILKKVADALVAVPEGGSCGDFRGVIRLNGTAAEIWNWVGEGKDREELIRLLSSTYGVDEAESTRAVDGVLTQLRSAGILEE